VLEGYKGKSVDIVIDMLTADVRRDIDLEYLQRAEAFMRDTVAQGRPFYLYFNHSMMHMPTVPDRSSEAGAAPATGRTASSNSAATSAGCSI
jgi:hypothetical protein